MTSTVWNSGGMIRQSRSLRALLEHARQEAPTSARLDSVGGGQYRLTINFVDGSVGVSVWQDWRVCADWLAVRRSWPNLLVFGLTEFRKRYVKTRGLE